MQTPILTSLKMSTLLSVILSLGLFFGQKTYASSLPDFFSQLYIKHSDKIDSIYNDYYQQTCDEMGIEVENEKNQKKIIRLFFYNKLFTSDGASDCTTGGILNIPYFWHWVEPNPRHQIIFKPKSKLLRLIPPPNGFKRYKSYADVDRLPRLYLSDLVSESPKFCHPSCGCFFTFGWCSEREMAFTLLLTILGYDCKVKQVGIHVWSEICLRLVGKKKKNKAVIVKIDNTMNSVVFLDAEADYVKWEKDFGNGTHVKWYNLNAHSVSEISAVKSIKISKSTKKRIENLVNGWIINDEL